jgi:hypothetical protein
MKTYSKSAYFINPELNLIWVVKHQIQFVRTKIVEGLNSVRFLKYDEKNLASTSRYIDKTIVEFSKTENEILNQYYLEGMKLFSQGPFAQNKGKNTDQLGIYL